MNHEEKLEWMRKTVADCQRHADRCIRDARKCERSRNWMPLTVALCILANAGANFYLLRYGWGILWVALAMFNAATWHVGFTRQLEAARIWKMKWAQMKREGQEHLARMERFEE